MAKVRKSRFTVFYACFSLKLRWHHLRSRTLSLKSIGLLLIKWYRFSLLSVMLIYLWSVIIMETWEHLFLLHSSKTKLR